MLDERRKVGTWCFLYSQGRHNVPDRERLIRLARTNRLMRAIKGKTRPYPPAEQDYGRSA